MALTVIPAHVTTRAALSKELNQFLRRHFSAISSVSSVCLLRTLYGDGTIQSITGYVQGPGSLLPYFMRIKRFHASGFANEDEAQAVYLWVEDAFCTYADQVGAANYTICEFAEVQQGGL